MSLTALDTNWKSGKAGITKLSIFCKKFYEIILREIKVIKIKKGKVLGEISGQNP